MSWCAENTRTETNKSLANMQQNINWYIWLMKPKKEINIKKLMQVLTNRIKQYYLRRFADILIIKINLFLQLTMFEGQRLSYIVPGYTGHIPKKVYDSTVPLEKKQGTSHIPGYAAYVHSIKSENLHANTFGKITYDVNNNNYVRGQDLQPSEKYVSTQTKVNIPPSEMLRRTAADIVGIPNKEIKVHEPKLGQSTGPEIDQFTITKTQQFRRSVSNQKNPWADTKVIQKEGKQYVRLQEPLPGYTGFGKRILANNIFGKTFAECRKESHRDTEKLNHERQRNFNDQLNANVPLKF